eukprot:TRINITY_DN7386_c0_g1_i1.p1 TRINITY_DN7386_c0_g1~~TRINITY_DN7386_c0_g1_i1.p1  ORF type:complete len:309 (-),score=57.54 TRINITY_DN7386_c0_g1_i1:171-1049(-)
MDIGDEMYRSMLEEQEQIENFAADIKNRRNKVKQQQSQLEEARKAWKADMKALAHEKDSPDYSDRYEFLLEVKKVLEKEAREFNEEVSRLNHAQRLLNLKEKKVRLLETTFDQYSEVDASANTTAPHHRLNPSVLESLVDKISKIESELATFAQLIRSENQGCENRPPSTTPSPHLRFDLIDSPQGTRHTSSVQPLQSKWKGLLGQKSLGKSDSIGKFDIEKYLTVSMDISNRSREPGRLFSGTSKVGLVSAGHTTAKYPRGIHDHDRTKTMLAPHKSSEFADFHALKPAWK